VYCALCVASCMLLVVCCVFCVVGCALCDACICLSCGVQSIAVGDLRLLRLEGHQCLSWNEI